MQQQHKVIKDTIELMNKSPQNFERLVLICMDSYDSEKGRILQHFSRSTRFAFLCTAQISNFQQKTSWFFFHFFEKFRENFQNFVIFQQNFDEFCPEFHETFSNFLRKRRKCWFAGNFLIFAKFADISGIGEKVHSFISSVQSYPYLVQTYSYAQSLCNEFNAVSYTHLTLPTINWV